MIGRDKWGLVGVAVKAKMKWSTPYRFGPHNPSGASESNASPSQWSCGAGPTVSRFDDNDDEPKSSPYRDDGAVVGKKETQ